MRVPKRASKPGGVGRGGRWPMRPPPARLAASPCAEVKGTGARCAEPRIADTTAPFPCGRGRSAASVLFVSQSLDARALPIFAALMLATFRPTAARPTEKYGSASRLCFSPCPSAASLPKAEVGRLRALRQSADLSPSLPVSFGYRDVLRCDK